MLMLMHHISEIRIPEAGQAAAARGLTNRPGALSDLCHHWRIHKLDPATTVSNFQVLTTAIQELFILTLIIVNKNIFLFYCII